jgi:hypothetical protein
MGALGTLRRNHYLRWENGGFELRRLSPIAILKNGILIITSLPISRSILSVSAVARFYL